MNLLSPAELDELVTAIAARLQPAELDTELAAWVRANREAGYAVMRWPFGHVVQPCYIEIRLNPDGSIVLELKDWMLQIRWSWTIRPASSAAPPAGEPNPATSGRTQPS